QRGDCRVELVLQQGFSEVARRNLDALGGRLVEPSHLRRLIAYGTEATGDLDRRVLELGQVGRRRRRIGRIAIHTATGGMDGSVERFLEEIAFKALSRQADRTARSRVELIDQ